MVPTSVQPAGSPLALKGYGRHGGGPIGTGPEEREGDEYTRSFLLVARHSNSRQTLFFSAVMLSRAH